MLSKIRISVVVLLLLAVLACTPFRTLKITGHSMEPTLHDGETYLLDHFYWKAGGLRRGDIVVVRHGEETWVKRLVGMPGDKLRIKYRGDNWILGVDNLTSKKDLDLPAVSEAAYTRDLQVDPGEVFVIGDNLNWSSDSTNQEAGAFTLANILGVARTFTMRREFPFRHHL
jgi:signal peptidase I